MKILVVEDNPKHLQDAVETLSKFGVEVVTATNAHQAVKKMCNHTTIRMRKRGKGATPLVDGVITDVYLPLIIRDDKPHLNTSENPCGLNVAFVAHNAGIPFVFCTAGYHHGSKFEWILRLILDLDWPNMVDSRHFSGDHTKMEEVDRKDWKSAFEYLQRLTAKA